METMNTVTLNICGTDYVVTTDETPGYMQELAAQLDARIRKMLENLKKVYYPSDQAGFPMAVSVAALNYKKPFGYYMNKIHTKKDTVLEITNVNLLRAALTTLICGDAVN